MRYTLGLSILPLLWGRALSQSVSGPNVEATDETVVILAPGCDSDTGICPYPFFDPDVATAVSYTNSSGMAVVFGDINIDTIETFLSYKTDLTPGTVLKRKRGVSVPRANRWPGATVLYKYESESTQMLRSSVIDDAIANWKAILPFLKFEIQATGAATAGVTRIVIGEKCSSNVGYRTDDTMQITLAAGCGVAEVVHELGHALGLYHEQSRSDRAAAGVQFICSNLLDYASYTTMKGTCCPNNADDCCDSASSCCAGKACNYRFASTRGGSLEGGSYDLNSLMHYFDRAFGLEENGIPRITLQGAPEEPAVRARLYPSPGDAEKICDLYNTDCGGYCGDGILQAGEECDFAAGGSANCSRVCKIERCGDGIIQIERGEECDPGTGKDETFCTQFCKFPFCGDGIIQPQIGEVCDDGNFVNGDGCSSTCQIETCGDGIVQAGSGEECDDGNTTDNDGCSSKCKIEKCGDGIVQTGEECDDGNTTSGDGCSSICKKEGTVVDPGKYPTPTPNPDPAKPPTSNPSPLPQDPGTPPSTNGTPTPVPGNPDPEPKPGTPGSLTPSGNRPSNPTSGTSSGGSSRPATSTTSGAGGTTFTGAASSKVKMYANRLLSGLALIHAGLLI